MADKRITELNLHTSPQLSDVIAIVNSNETKKTTYGTLYYGIRDGLVSGSSQIILGDVTNFTSYSSSVETKIYNLTSVTSSYLVSEDTGSLMVTGSLSDGTLTFTKGDSSTFDIDFESVFTKSAYISCYSTSSQALVSSGSEQAITFTSVWAEDGVSLVSGSEITFAEAGTYEFNFVAQVQNTDNVKHDAFFWIKYNGENFPNSTTQLTLQARKSSGEPNTGLMTVSIIGIAQNDNDYIELYWTGDSTTLSLVETPAFNSVPETPSIIASIKRVG